MAHILIVLSRYYDPIAEDLIIGAIAALDAYGVTHDTIEVPGAFEIPAAVRLGIESGRYDGYIALGCIIRGETSHYDIVASESARGLNDLAVQFCAPIGYGILTCDTMDQAKSRAALNEGNKGRDAALACLQLLHVRDHFGLGKKKK